MTSHETLSAADAEMNGRVGVDINRRNFLKAIFGGGILLGAGAFLSKGSLYRTTANRIRSLEEAADAQYLRQVITGDAATGRVIMWQGESALSRPGVEYRIKGQPDIRSVSAQEDFFSDDGERNFQYVAELKDLAADADYEYRLVSGGQEGEWHPLRTAGVGGFRCLVFPDSQSSDYSDWEKLAQNAAARNPNASFFINMGDIVDNGEDRTQWQAWFHGVRGIIDRIPFVPVMGNHETYDLKWEVRLPEAYLRYFAVPDNGSREFGRYYYSFDYGPAHFVVLNTQWEETEEFKQGLLEEQVRWLQEDAARSKRKWSIALLHKDVLQYRIHNRPERQEGISDAGEAFMPLFDELGMDLVLTAHLHTYRNRGHIHGFHRDPRGPLYILTGVAGDVRYPGLWIDHALDEVVAPQPETDNYLTMDVAEDEITVKCFLPDGREIDRAVLKK